MRGFVCLVCVTPLPPLVCVTLLVLCNLSLPPSPPPSPPPPPPPSLLSSLPRSLMLLVFNGAPRTRGGGFLAGLCAVAVVLVTNLRRQ